MALPENTKNDPPIKYRWIILPGFLCTLAAIYFFGQSFLRAFSAGYHPFSDGAHFASLRLKIALIALIVVVVLWFAHILLAGRIGAVTRYVSLGVWGVAVMLALYVGEQAVPPQPDAFKRVVGHVTYAVPRQFRPSCGQLNGDKACGTYCWSTGKAMYAGGCPKEQGMPKHVSVQLGAGNLMDTWDISHHLKSAEIVHDGDQIISIGKEDRIKRFPAGDLTGFSINVGQMSYFFDDTSTIVAVVKKNVLGRPWHTITQRTPDGVLRYETQSLEFPMPDSWAEHSKGARQLIDSWRCKEPTCGGQFKE